MRIDQGHTRLRISISLAGSESTRLHLTALLIIWALGAAFATVSLVTGEPILGTSLIHSVWLASGVVVLWAYTRFAIGREVLTFSDGRLTISRRPLPLGYRRTYLLSKVRHLRIDTTGLRLSNTRHRLNIWRWRGERGLILFDYDLKAVRFGRSLTIGEAKELLQVINDSGYCEGRVTKRT